MAGDRARQVAIALAAAATVTSFAQQQPPPTFRSDINYVQIPARVLDARGNFVSGLTQSDFTVIEDGVAQTIASFSAVEIPAVPLQSGVRDPAEYPLEPVATNELIDAVGRVYVLVLDNQSMPAWAALRTRQVLRGFIRDHLDANDLAAIAVTGTGRGQPLTRSRRLLDDAIERLLSDADPTDDAGEAAAHRILNFIADTADRMASIKDRRKALVLMTPSSICGLFQIPSRGEPSTCADGARHALRRAMMADVTIYTIDPRGAVPASGAPAEVADPGEAARWPVITRGPYDAARYLAEESGGFAIVNSNSLSAGFARIVREQSAYYMLGYYSTNDRADGKIRRNSVTVSRSGLRVVHRGSYMAPLDRVRLSR
jgi:VWFA-related protein